MKLSISLMALFVSVNIAHASSLDVYQDQTFYHYAQKNNFIGFSKALKASCEGSSMALLGMLVCSKADGKVEMKLSLAGNETKKIEVLFEISYDKDLKVNY